MDYQPSGIVRLLGTLVRIGRTLLWIGTVLVVLLLVLSFTRGAGISLTGVIEAPFSAALPDGRVIGVDESGFIDSYENFEIGQELQLFAGNAELRAAVTISDDDIDSRIAISIAILIWISCSWVGLNALKNLFESTARGEPFSSGSPRWLRQLAAALLIAGLAAQTALIALNRTVDTDIPVRIDAGPSPMLLMASGLVVLVLAELFAEAVRLKDFEEATI